MASPKKKLSKSGSTQAQNGETQPLFRNNTDGEASPPSKKSFLAFEMMPGNDPEEFDRLMNERSSAALPRSSAAQGHGHGHGVADGEKCGVYKTLANIFISFVGAGILSLPHSFAMSGLFLGTLFLIVLAMLAYYCILLLVDCKKLLENRGVVTYAEVAEHALGPTGKSVVEVLLVLSQTGFCAAYVIFIYDTLPPVLPVVSPLAVILTIVPIQVLMAMLRDLSALAPFSLFAECAHVVGMLVVLKDDYQQYSLEHEKTPLAYSKGFEALPFLFGVFIYCYEGISMILPIEDAMADKGKFRGTFTTGFVSVTSIFLVFGAVGYCAFGEETKELITDNLPPGDWTTPAVKIALCIALFFTFPIMMVPVYEVIERSMEGASWFDRNVAPGRRWMIMRVMRTVIVGLIALVAVSVPGFHVFIVFIGSFCCSSLAFILPATCHLVLFSGSISTPRRLLDYMMIVFGFTGMIFGVAESVKGMVAGKVSH